MIRTSIGAGLACASLAIAASAGAQEASEAAAVFTAELSSLNNSGVTGKAYVAKTEDDRLTAIVIAQGLQANQQHPQHIHGLEDATAAGSCPSLAEDTDGDNIITLEEGLPAYGPVLLPLEPFPEPGESQVVFAQVYQLGQGEIPGADALGQLQNRVVVLHGMDFGGSYVADLPVACGPLQPVLPSAQAPEGDQTGDPTGDTVDDVVEEIEEVL